MSLESQLTRYSIYIYIYYSTLQKGSDDGNTFKHLSCAWETPMTFFFAPSWPVISVMANGHP